MLIKRLLSTVLGATLVMAALAAGPTQRAASSGSRPSDAVPYQFLAKTYTEGLGRLPTQPEWRDGVEFFEKHRCNPAMLARWGSQVLGSTEFAGLDHDPVGVTLAAYRAILNRDPVDAELPATGATFSPPRLFAELYTSGEFRELSAKICDPAEPSYHFGTNPAPTPPTTSPGFSGTQEELQALLNATPPGGTVTMAKRAVVRLTSTLTVPAGVALTTHGGPGTQHYPDMARLVRVHGATGFTTPTVRVQPGASLTHMWVDGQLGDPRRYGPHSAFNVQTLSGDGTKVSDNRLSNPAGGTNLSALGVNDTGVPCTNNEFNDNLVEGYGNSHWVRMLDGGGVVGPWADGLSIACEDSIVSGNQIVDATDVGLIVFNSPGATQRSHLVDNVILNAGNQAFASIGSSPWINLAGGDPPGTASSDFSGTVVADNLLWTSPAAPSAIGIAVGVKPWSAQFSYHGRGITVVDNSSGSEELWAANGIVVSGMLDATVQRNDLDVHIVDGAPICTTSVDGIYQQCAIPSRLSLCEPGELGVDVEGVASGTIDGSFVRRSYSGCIVGIVKFDDGSDLASVPGQRAGPAPGSGWVGSGLAP